MSWETSSLTLTFSNSSFFRTESEDLSSKAKWTLVALSITTIVSVIIFAMSLCSIFGAVGTIGQLLSTATSATTAMACLIGNMIVSCRESCKPKNILINQEPFPVLPKLITPISQALPHMRDEAIEKPFWEALCQNKELHRLWEMYINSSLEAVEEKKPLAELFNHYVKFRQLSESAFNLIEDERKILGESIAAQLANRSFPKKVAHNQYELPDGNMLHIRPTVGDGSCGIHALLGELIQGAYQTHAAEKRNTLCRWLRAKHESNSLPLCITNVLEDYFLNFDLAPAEFVRGAGEKRKQYYKDYSQLTKEKQDDQKKLFIQDKKVFEAYLTCLANTGVYLLQDEMVAAALCFDKRVIFYQPGWYNDREAIASQTINDSGKDTVYVWYNGYNHYQRAEVLAPNLLN